MPNDDQTERRTRARVRRLAARVAELTGRYAGRLFRWVVASMFLIVTVIGLLFITRGTAVRRVRGMGADGTPVSPAEPTFPLAVALLTGSPIVAGNRVELALNGDGTYPRLWADLRSARRAITVQMYYAAPGRVADSLGAILAERARTVNYTQYVAYHVGRFTGINRALRQRSEQ